MFHFLYIIRHYIFIFLLICSTTGLIAVEPDLLKESDVNKMMQQIFEQHVEKKEISKDIIKSSFRSYIDQFDSSRIYLLESEVEPYLNPSDKELALYISQYKKGDFSIYHKLNDMIQHAIARTRDIRAEIEKNDVKGLFQSAKIANTQHDEDMLDPDYNIPFPKTKDVLKVRQKSQIEQFIHAQMRNFGQKIVLNNQKKTFDLYEKQLKNHENHYLFVDTDGKSLSNPEKENIKTLYILKALANSLDAHTTFFDSAEAYDMRVHLEKEIHGIGVVLQQGVEGVIISKVVQGGPADKSGLFKSGDEIVKINDKSIAGEPFEKVMELIRGDDGSALTLTLKRKAEKQDPEKMIDVSLKRAPIVMNEDRVEISYETYGDGIIGMLTLNSFYQSEDGISSEIDLKNAINELKKKGNLRGLILDFRENSGGFLSQAIKVTGLFIRDGVVVISKYSSGEEQIYRDVDGKVTYKGPLIILTSKATASAAEIVAQALQDYGLALIVGDERTYGKGSIQSQTVTDNQSVSFFKVTIGKYYTVSGKSPQIKGVKADIVIPTQFAFEHLGEEYLTSPLSYDTIKPLFDDKLTDIDSKYKDWFMKYYVPNIEKPTQEWNKLIPILKKNSEYRIANNKNYQLFLQRLQGKVPEEAIEDTKEFYPLKNGEKNHGSDDLQMTEAVNVVKDMIILDSMWNINSVGLGSTSHTKSNMAGHAGANTK